MHYGAVMTGGSLDTTMAQLRTQDYSDITQAAVVVATIPLLDGSGDIAVSVMPPGYDDTIDEVTATTAGLTFLKTGENTNAQIIPPGEIRTAARLGTAAVLNTGTGIGNIPLLGTGGKLPTSTYDTEVTVAGMVTALGGSPDDGQFIQYESTGTTLQYANVAYADLTGEPAITSLQRIYVSWDGKDGTAHW